MPSPRLARWLLAATVGFVVCGALGACTNAKLEEIPPEPLFRDDKLEVLGALCTQKPETLVFPLRVLFVVDASVSMDVTDPPDPVTGETGRERAVRETWEKLLDEGPEGVRIGIVRFSSQAQSRTATDLDGDALPDTYFTADRTLLAAATKALGQTDRTTNYANAIGEAYYEVRTELMAADNESLPLSKYVVIFLSDGVPDTDDSDSRGNASEDIYEAVAALQSLADTFHVGDFAFHTAYVSSGQGIAFEQLATGLLGGMSDAGGGTFRSFPSGEALNFLFVDLTVLRRVFTLKTLVVLNENVIMDESQIPQPPPLDIRVGMPDVASGDVVFSINSATVLPEEGDVVRVAIYADPGDAPVYLGEDIPLEQWPVQTTIAGVPPGEWYPYVCLDVGGDDPDCDGANDIRLFYRDGDEPFVAPDPAALPDSDVTPSLMDDVVGDAGLAPFVVHPMAFVDLNESLRVECGEPMVDSDGDGLSDVVELDIGTNPLERDTDDDGLNDRIEWEYGASGLDPLETNESCFVANPCFDLEPIDGFCDCVLDLDIDGVCDCNDDCVEIGVDALGQPQCSRSGDTDACFDAAGHDCVDVDEDGWCDCPDRDLDGKCDYDDSDGDGLHDCEEVFFGTAQRGTDTDADGLPDVLEVRFETNPTLADNTDDLDFDRTINGIEVASGSNPLCDDAALRSKVAYRYQLDELGLSGTDEEAAASADATDVAGEAPSRTTCYDFSVSNITLVPTLARPAGTGDGYPGDGWNRILVYAGEVAFDDPKAFALYRMACVMAAYYPEGGYKNPPAGEIRLSESDFVPVEEFDAKIHCRYP